MSDLILEAGSGGGLEEPETYFRVILPNIPGQKYTFGSEYPEERKKGEEFVLCRFSRYQLFPSHFTIRVDAKGQYWIRNALDSNLWKTVVNGNGIPVMEGSSLLKVGDIISAASFRKYLSDVCDEEDTCSDDEEEEDDDRDDDFGPVVFRVLERQIDCSNLCGQESLDEDEQGPSKHFCDAPSPSDETVILANVLSYLPLEDLKSARLVSKQWKSHATPFLEEKAKVCFDFGATYVNPSISTNVFRYLHEMQNVKIRQLEISLFEKWSVQHVSLCQRPLLYSRGEPGRKMHDDIRRLLTSNHKFSSLRLSAVITHDWEFSVFHSIFQQLGDGIVELNLYDEIQFLPRVVPPFPMMPSLKSYTHEDYPELPSTCSVEKKQEIYKKWTSHVVPLFQENLEVFSCRSDRAAESFLQEFIKHSMPALRRIMFDTDSEELPVVNNFARIIALLAQLQNPHLTHLDLKYLPKSMKQVSNFHKLLWKNAEFLQDLKIRIGQNDGATPLQLIKIKLPLFPKLKELDLKYSCKTRVEWESGLDYNQHFPSLRTLKVMPHPCFFNWERENDVFTTFFSRGNRNIASDTVKVLRIPVLTDPEDVPIRLPLAEWRPVEAKYQNFQRRLEKIREMFPKLIEMKLKDVGAYSSYPEVVAEAEHWDDWDEWDSDEDWDDGVWESEAWDDDD